MDDKKLDQLEQDVAEARARLMARVDALRSPAVYGNAKQELADRARSVKDGVIEQARSQATDRTNDFVESIKERIIANPLAAASIGAGVAWHLWKHPPITTLLIGAGVYSLMSGSGKLQAPRYEPYARRYPSSYVPGGIAGYGYPDEPEAPQPSLVDRGREAAQVVSEKASQLASQASSAVSSAVSTAMDQTRSKMDDLREVATASSRSAMDQVREFSQSTSERLRSGQAEMQDRLQDRWQSARLSERLQATGLPDRLSDERTRDGVLLAFAAMAVGGAVAVALARRGEDVAADVSQDAEIEVEEHELEPYA